EPGPFRDQFEPLFQRENISQASCCIFTQTVTDHGCGLYTPTHPKLCYRVLDNKQGELCQPGVIHSQRTLTGSFSQNGLLYITTPAAIENFKTPVHFPVKHCILYI